MGFLFKHFKTFEFASRAIYISMLDGDTEIFLFLLRKGYSLIWHSQAETKEEDSQYRKKYNLPESYSNYQYYRYPYDNRKNNKNFISSLTGNWDMEQNPIIYN